ncbi:MAG: hypothetical protein KBB52_02345 [Candidatus Omnitrophica bacterium]|nr:hypothetical protein [Candidatus Omnitrophota bacterium]
MSATIYDFKEVSLPDFKFPEFIFLDTSFLINAFCPVPEKPGLPSDTNEKCSEFLDVLKKNAREGKTCLITSDLVVNEFFHFILKEKAEYVELEGAFKNHRHSYKKNPSVELMKDHPDLIGKYHSSLTLYKELMIKTPIDILEPNDLGGSENQAATFVGGMMDAIKNYNVLPSDACNIAISKLLEIDTFVVLDKDYYRVDGINVYTCFSKMARTCSICKPS